MRIPITRPSIGAEEKAAVLAVLESGELTQGRWVAEFEQAFAALCGTRYAVATSSGTTAIHLALLVHGVGPGDEVVVPSFTFAASATPILHVGATPVFADIDPETFTVGANEVEQVISGQTKAVIAVDLYGHPADLPRLERLCRQRGLVLIEDACQAHGAEVDGRRVGSFGTGCFSFYGSKNMTTSEGGMITTDDERVAEKTRMLRQHGSRQQYLHEQLGFNFRMTNLAAAIGLAQLRKLPDLNQQRIANAASLTQRLEGLQTPVTRPGAKHVFHQYTVRLPGCRDEVMSGLREQGVDSRVYYPLPVHRQPVFQQRGYGAVELPVTEQAVREALSLPVFPGLKPRQLDYIANGVRQLARLDP